MWARCVCGQDVSLPPLCDRREHETMLRQMPNDLENDSERAADRKTLAAVSMMKKSEVPHLSCLKLCVYFLRGKIFVIVPVGTTWVHGEVLASPCSPRGL